MSRQTKIAVAAVAAALVLMLVGWAVTLILFKAGSKTEGPRRAASHLAR